MAGEASAHCFLGTANAQAITGKNNNDASYQYQSNGNRQLTASLVPWPVHLIQVKFCKTKEKSGPTRKQTKKQMC